MAQGFSRKQKTAWQRGIMEEKLLIPWGEAEREAELGRETLPSRCSPPLPPSSKSTTAPP